MSLIGAARSMASAVVAALVVPSESFPRDSVAGVDATLDAWLLVVAAPKKNIMSSGGDIYGLVFHDYIAIHA